MHCRVALKMKSEEDNSNHIVLQFGGKKLFHHLLKFYASTPLRMTGLIKPCTGVIDHRRSGMLLHPQ
jgi:hypothetical protein